jgi:hypothetical protein
MAVMGKYVFSFSLINVKISSPKSYSEDTIFYSNSNIIDGSIWYQVQQHNRYMQIVSYRLVSYG